MHSHAPLEHLVFHNRWRKHSASTKTAAGGTLLLLACVLPVGLWLGAILLVAAALVLIGARIPVRAWLLFLAPQTGFLLAAVLPIAITDQMGAAEILLRGLAAASSAAVISLTTPVPEVLAVLRKWHVPATLIELAFLVYRMASSTLAMLEGTLLGHRVRSTGQRMPLDLMASSAGLLLARTLRLGQRLEHGADVRGIEGLPLLPNGRSAT